MLPKSYLRLKHFIYQEVKTSVTTLLIQLEKKFIVKEITQGVFIDIEGANDIFYESIETVAISITFYYHVVAWISTMLKSIGKQNLEGKKPSQEGAL